MAKRVARIGVFVALAMAFSYIEVLIPFNFGIPGVKLGIANIVAVTGLYIMKAREVWIISMARILLMGMLFGNGVSLVYSLSGGILSLAVMMLLKKTGKFSVIGVSISGGVSHNVGQVLAVALVMETGGIFYYLAVLLVAGAVTGMLIGILSGKIVDAIKKAESLFC